MGFRARYLTARTRLSDIRAFLGHVEGDLAAFSRLGDGRTFIEEDFDSIVKKLDELATYAHEIKDRVERKRQDGEEADRRIDAMIGVVA